MAGQILKLPVGYWCDDTFHKSVSLGPVTGLVEDMVQEKSRSHAYRITQLLTGCITHIGSITPITPDIVRELSITDRDFLLLKLRELTFGSKIECILTCPNSDCNKKMNVDFNTNALVFEKRGLNKYYFTIETDNTSIEFRLPNGGDQESVADFAVKDTTLAETVIFRRCIRSINGKYPSETEIDNLAQESKDAVQKQMEQLDPLTDLNMLAVCPECGNEFLAPFDIQDFFLDELDPNPDAFYREIHYLAYYYHWSLDQILSLPRWKRKKYIEFLIDEISREREEVF